MVRAAITSHPGPMLSCAERSFLVWFWFVICTFNEKRRDNALNLSIYLALTLIQETSWRRDRHFTWSGYWKAVPLFLSYFFFRLCYTYTHERLKNCCISKTVLRPIEMITLSHWLHLPAWKKFGEHGGGWICKTVCSTWDKGLVHTYPFLFENRDIFSPVWSAVHTYPVKNGHRKRIFWKTLSRVEIFENAILLFSHVWMGENEGFWKQLRFDVGYQ